MVNYRITTLAFGGMSPWELIFVGVFLIPFLIGILKGVTSTIFSSKELLVLQSFSVKRHWIGEGLIIDISGRKTGLISTLLAVFGIESKCHLKAFNDVTEFEESNLSGNKRTVIPNDAIVEIAQGYYRPVFKLFMGFVFFCFLLLLLGAFFRLNDFGEFIQGDFNFFGTPVPVLASLVISTIGFVYCLVSYIFGKSIQISIGNGDDKYGFAFKRGVIEGVKIDLFKLEELALCYKELVLCARQEKFSHKTPKPVESKIEYTPEKYAPKSSPSEKK